MLNISLVDLSREVDMSKQACWKDMAAKFGFCKICGKIITSQVAQSCTDEHCPQRLAEKDNARDP